MMFTLMYLHSIAHCPYAMPHACACVRACVHAWCVCSCLALDKDKRLRMIQNLDIDARSSFAQINSLHEELANLIGRDLSNHLENDDREYTQGGASFDYASEPHSITSRGGFQNSANIRDLRCVF